MSRAARVDEIVGWLERKGSKRLRDGLVRYGIVTDKAFGIQVGDLQRYAKALGRDHALAQELWRTGWYEARMLCSWIAEPARLTPAQMDRWAKDWDNWGICDTIYLHCFDRSPHAWGRAKAWRTSKAEFVKRGAFALVAGMAVHDKACPDGPFLDALDWMERAADDERNFVKKGVNWALRAVGRRNRALRAPATALARRLAGREEPAPRWIGKDALRDFAKVDARKAAKA